HIAKLQAAEKKEWTPEERDALLGGPPEPPKPRTEAEERAAWDKAEAARSEMQQSAGCGFDAVTLFPELYPEGRPPAPGRTAPEPVDEPVKHRVGIGQVGIVQFGPDSKMHVRVLTVPDEHGNFKATPTSGMLVSQVVFCNVKDFAGGF